MKHLLTLKDFLREEILDLIKLAEKVKKKPGKFEKKLEGKTLLTMFAKPSLRTRLSFDAAMHQLGGHTVFYNLSESTLGKKESIKDFAKVTSRYVNVIMARLYEHKEIEELAKYADVPVINGLTDDFHPCQILGDLLTMKEKFGTLDKIKIVYIGDAFNNITHSLIVACNKLGIKIVVCCPDKAEYKPNPKILEGYTYTYEKDPKKAVQDASIIYTDTWMSYQIPESKKKARIKILQPYQVNKKLFDSSEALFMHCLPAARGYEVTDEVIDSERSIVYDQAENRTYVEKAVLLRLLGK